MATAISNKQATEFALMIKDGISSYISENMACYIEWLREQGGADCIAELNAIEADARKEANR